MTLLQKSLRELWRGKNDCVLDVLTTGALEIVTVAAYYSRRGTLQRVKEEGGCND
jgi:hypothetical protein